MSKTEIWCCTKKYFLLKKKFDVKQDVISCRQKQVDGARKSVSCQQKKIDVAGKKYFMLTKVR